MCFTWRRCVGSSKAFQKSVVCKLIHETIGKFCYFEISKCFHLYFWWIFNCQKALQWPPFTMCGKGPVNSHKGEDNRESKGGLLLSQSWRFVCSNFSVLFWVWVTLFCISAGKKINNVSPLNLAKSSGKQSQ